MTFALRFNTSFLFDVFSMVNENFFVTCKVKMHTNVFTKIIEHVEPKMFKLGCR